MLLLVSVRSSAEVEPALTGGADIIDAKEPTRGSLGPVSPHVLTRIANRTPTHMDLSIALGDFVTPEAVHRAITHIPPLQRDGRLYLKLGFANVSSSERVEALLDTAVAASGNHPASPLIIAVAYADHESAGTVSPLRLCQAAAEARATGLLLDTYHKGGGHLFGWMASGEVKKVVRQAQAAGMLAALAGGLTASQVRTVRGLAPDVIGFRGAACIGGREGKIDPDLVRQLRAALQDSSSGSIQAESGNAERPVGETPDVSANLGSVARAKPLIINN